MKRGKVKDRAWKVYVGKKLLEIVWFDDEKDKDEVKRALVNNKYDNNIVVHKSKLKNKEAEL